VLNLRPYQSAAIDAIRAQFAAGTKRTLVVMPTGTGKTVVFAEVARRVVERGGRVLILAHRGELLEQALGKLQAIGVDAAIEQADRRAGDAAVVVASVQSLHARRLASFAPDAFALVIVDEAHHAVADGYRAILDYFASAFVLGVTATADRLDGTGLEEAFSSVAYRYDLPDAIRDGWLAPIRPLRFTIEEVDLDGVRVRGGDLEAGALADAMTAEAAIHGVVSPLVEHAGDRKTIVFAVDVAHAEVLAAAINVYRPYRAAVVHGGMSRADRTDVLARFARGDVQYLANCALLTEGYDEPTIACVAMARPTKSRALYTQCVGRGTRLAPGKTDCLLLDFVGLTKRHRLIGPDDLLGGVEQVAAEPIVERPEREVIEEIARESIAVQRRAVVEYLAVEVDPFLVGDASPLHTSAGLATQSQLETLERFGVRSPDGLTRRDASRIIGGLIKRREAGLCSYKQARLLKRWGVDARGITFERASELITARLERRKSATVARRSEVTP
jgi:superfamily II DNA or RNA helicase